MDHKAYMVLPSLRLACCWMLGRKLAVLPLRVEGLATYKAKANSENHDDHLVVYYHKNVSIYRLQELGLTVESGEKVATPFYSTVFNKKIECMTFNDKGTAIASDKFGDIYALDGQTVPRYLNSNLGIPTFLQFVRHGPHSYVIIGDQQTKLKIYNMEQMHQIVSLWFICNKIPLQLQSVGEEIWLLTKSVETNKFSQEEYVENQFQVHVLRSSDIVEEEFPGKMLYTSTDVNDQVCGYQTLVNCPDKNKVFLLKMYQSFIKMIELTQIEKKKELSFDIEKGEWDYLDARIMNHDNCAMLAIIYGKDYEYEPEEDQDYLTQYYLKEDEQNTSISRITINKYEHVMVIKLEGML